MSGLCRLYESKQRSNDSKHALLHWNIVNKKHPLWLRYFNCGKADDVHTLQRVVVPVFALTNFIFTNISKRLKIILNKFFFRNKMNSSVIKTERSLDKAHFCVKCEKQITDRYFLKALNAFWHEDCLKCNCCNCRLADVGSTLFTRENVILCKSDYIRWDKVQFFKILKKSKMV